MSFDVNPNSRATRGEPMGGAFTGSGATDDGVLPACPGQDVLQQLDDVFSDPNSDRYKYAKKNNIFDKVGGGTDNYRQLISAYVEAGVDVCARWGAYLRVLGRSSGGQQDIKDIADIRHDALKHDLPVKTSTHPTGGNAHVKKHKGSSKTDPSTIESPFDPPPP
jgi:hypothetical protein